jgi:ABC-type sugar transport system permease subunit
MLLKKGVIFMESHERNWGTIAFLGPAVFLLFVLMVYPSLETIRLSFMDRQGENYVGFENYQYALTSSKMQEAFGNNLLWLIIFTLGTVLFGLLIATLADRVSYEAFAKAIIFLPMAISFVGAGVIWKFVYDLNPPGTPLQPGNQIGILNAMLLPLRPDDTLNDALNAFQREGIPANREDVVNIIIATETTALQEAVTAGDLTQERTDHLLTILPNAANDYVDGKLPPSDQEWQALGQWPRVAIDTINTTLASQPEGSGRAICNALPYACVYEIQDVEEAAIDNAVEANELDQARADDLKDGIIGAAQAYVTRGERPAGEGWQTVDQWDSIIAGLKRINLRSVNSSLDTGIEPIDWIRQQGVNNFALIIVAVWIWTGFCMVVLSAALKAIPQELYEAARVDGANEFRIFFSITIPQLMPTLTVVTTTMIVNVLKVFDIVYVMTAGNFGTEVIANRMYQEMYSGNREFGHASAIAVVLMLAIIPVMIFNIAQFRKQEAER